MLDWLFHEINLEAQRTHTETIVYYFARMLNERILSLAFLLRFLSHACQQPNEATKATKYKHMSDVDFTSYRILCSYYGRFIFGRCTHHHKIMFPLNEFYYHCVTIAYIPMRWLASGKPLYMQELWLSFNRPDVHTAQCVDSPYTLRKRQHWHSEAFWWSI